MGIDHVMLKVSDWPKAKEYYTGALKPLGYEPVVDWGTGGGFGVSGETRGNIYVVQGPLAHAQALHTAEVLQVCHSASCGVFDPWVPRRRKAYTRSLCARSTN